MDEKPFKCIECGEQFRVVDESGNTILTYRDRASAEQSAAMLNHIYTRGFKEGYRQGKASVTERFS